MLTLTAALALSDRLKAVSDSPRLDCEVLLCAALQRERAYLYTWPEKELTEGEEKLFLRYLASREKGLPVSYILKEKEFWSLSLSVNDSTLIPRPETELLVELALELMPDDSFIPQKVADLGTGTGAIAFALASERPHWQVWGLEKYAKALELAQHNQKRLGLDNIHLLCSDWFAALNEKHQFHLIVSNPPYIDENDECLHQGDVRFEPKTALVAADSGLADIDTIIRQSSDYLMTGGWLLFEHGFQQAEAVQALLKSNGFHRILTREDLAGHPRVTGGQLM